MLLADGVGQAFAQPEPSGTPADETPWAAGVSEEDKERANRLLALGNELLIQNRYAAALQHYQEAVAVWDHPAIRANMVVCFINLGRTLAAHENARLALRYGPAPYTKREAYVETLNYAKLLDAQVAHLEIRCDEPDVQVSLDGRPLMSCPGVRRRWLLAGAHQIVARKRGRLTRTSDLTLSPRSARRLDIQLPTLAEAARTERRWAPWKPWVVTAGGGALVALGGLLQLKARSDMERHDAELARLCGDEGCAPQDIPRSVERLESLAILESRIAVTTAFAGAAVAVTGLVGVYINRPQTILPDESGFSSRLAPAVTDGGGLLVLVGTF